MSLPAQTESWFAVNATRSWPLDDAATATDDAGQLLPPGIIVDLSVRFPEALGSYLCLSALAVTPQIVTALFAITDLPAQSPDGRGDASGFCPAAAISVPQPVDIGRLYPLTALASGVVGWIAFGDGSAAPYQGRFSTARQGQILASLAGPYKTPPVTSLGISQAATPLTGVVTLATGQDLAITTGLLDAVVAPGGIGTAVSGVPAIFINLIDSLNRDTMALYAGTCQTRPETGNCAQSPLESIAGVGPDCSGNLTLSFPGLTVEALAGGSGATLSLARGLAASCAAAATLPDPDGIVAGGGDLCASGAIPATPIDPTTCDPGPPVLAGYPSPASCLPFFDKFASIPYASGGEWTSTAGTALGSWTAGLESTPTVVAYQGQSSALVKIAPGGELAIDAVILADCPFTYGPSTGLVATALVRPHAGTGSGGGVISAITGNPGGTGDFFGIQAIWYQNDSVLALEQVARTAGVLTVTRLATTNLAASYSSSDASGWAEISLGLAPLLVGGDPGYQYVAALTPTPSAVFPAAAESDSPPTVAAVLGGADTTSNGFGVVGAPGGASFAYFFLRQEIPSNTPL